MIHGTWLSPRKESSRSDAIKVKYNSDGTVNGYNARLVARAMHKHGIDYEETVAPVAKITMVRLVLAVATTKRWQLHQMDVKNVFLQGDLEE